MRNIYSKAGVGSVDASIESADHGGFVAVASTADVDRDSESLAVGCFNPLPASIPVHLDHTMRAASVVARARPYYVGDKLMVEARFASTPDAQDVRAKVKSGVLDSLSVVFRGMKWKDIDGVRTCVKAELLAADIVSVPSQANARILSMRSVQLASREVANEVIADALLTLARAEIADCKRLGIRPRGKHQREVDHFLHDLLNDDKPYRPRRF